MPDTVLSEAGVLRREAMRTMLVGAVVQRRRRRRALRVAVVAVLAGAGLWCVLPHADRPREQPLVAGPAVPLIQVIGNDTSVLSRLSCGGSVTSIEFLDDLRLVSELSQNGREAGLVRRRGFAEVLPRIDDDWQAMQ
jgi:hypothetical protein